MMDWKGIDLYHYTSFKALNEILTNKEIWLGNLKYMNDRKEMRYFFEALKNSVKNDIPSKDEEIDTLFSMQLKRFEGQVAYAFSLSKLRDDASQWDRYANGGRGVCIKFSAEKLYCIIKEKAVLQPVFYVEELNNHEIKAILDTYLLEGVFFNGFDTVDELFDIAWACSAAFKHPTFNAEAEVRLCAFPFQRNDFFTGKLKYITGNNGLREYYPIKLCSNMERDYGGAIEEIILGPCSGVDKNMFFRYLQSVGVDKNLLTIEESNCPLR